MSTRTELAGDALPPDAAAALAGLVEEAGLRDAAPAGVPGRRPDQQLYEVEVAGDDGEVLRARFSDEDVPDAVLRLVGWVDTRAETTLRVQP